MSDDFDEARDFGGDAASRRKRAKTTDERASSSHDLSDAPPGERMETCPLLHLAVVPRTVTPVIQLAQAAVLYDKRHRTAHAAANPPAPTTTALTIGCVVTGGGGYAGGGTLAITAGSIRVFTDAGGNNLVGGPVPDPFSSAPAILLTPTTVRIDNGPLLAGVTVHVLGDARGLVTLTLTLDAQPGFTVNGPATTQSLVVELTLDVESLAPAARTLTVQRKLRNGKVVGVPRAHARSLRAKLHVHQGAPANAGQLVVHIPGPDAATLAVYSNERPTGGEADRFGVPFADAAADLWVAGAAAHPAGVWVGLGLRLANGTVLEYGDCARIIPIDQPPSSVGYEWEVNGMAVEKRHNGRRLMKDTQWEGAPSKATVFRSNAAPGMRLDTEVSSAHTTYGEFVLGPAYDYAELEGQLAELKRFHDAVHKHRVCTVTTPADIHSRLPGQYNVVWLAGGSRITVHNRYGNWGGTAQGTFAVPLWLLPAHLARLDTAEGAGAKTAAEIAAENDPDVDDLCLGLIAACEYYILVYRGCALVNVDDGPKTLLTVMFRTDFAAMYAHLGGAAKTAFQTWANAHPHGADRLLPNGYRGVAPLVSGPVIQAWLTSIWNPVNNKDTMSPPPGFPGHHTQQRIPYAMGLLGRDGTTQNIIAEYRTAGWQANSCAVFLSRIFTWADEIMLTGMPTWQQGAGGWAPVGGPASSRRRGQGLPVEYTFIPS